MVIKTRAVGEYMSINNNEPTQMIDVSVVWEACLRELEHEIGESAYQQWILPLSMQIQGSSMILNAINAYFVKRIEKEYLKRIKELVLSRSNGAITDVRLQLIQPTSFEPLLPTKAKKSPPTVQESDKLNVNYTFDAFVKGKSNALAYNACYELGKKTNQSSFDSLFIYGMSGLGKTHLMQAVAHRYQKAGRSVCYFDASEFMRKLMQAFAENKVPEFKSNIQKAELFILDDVHKMPSNKKKETAGVMLEIYTGFIREGKRAILASDRSPTQMEGFDSYFLSRFASGLTVMIDPPEMETRVQILEKKASKLALDLPKECAIFIAQNTPPDVRQLEGALTQINAHRTLLGQEVDLTMIRQVLKPRLMDRMRSINSDSIKDMVAEYYGVSVKELVGKKRVRHIARPRQMAMALTREFAGDSFPDIGQAFGGRDHTTVMHACDKVKELREEDPVFDKDYKALSATLEFF